MCQYEAVLQAGSGIHNSGNMARDVPCTIDPAFFPQLSDLRKLASIGDGSHARRDLMDLLEPHKLQISAFKIPMRVGGRYRFVTKMLSQAFLLPHLILASLFSHYQTAWTKLICPSVESITAFWHMQVGNPALEGHPLHARRDWQSRALPCQIHGDNAPITGCGKSWSQSMCIISFRSLLGFGTTVETNFLTVAIIVRVFIKFFTLRVVWKIIAWSWKIAWTGRHPFADVNGVPYHPESPEGKLAGTWLCGGFFALPWSIRCDCDFTSKDLEIIYIYIYICPCCSCKDHTYIYIYIPENPRSSS